MSLIKKIFGGKEDGKKEKTEIKKPSVELKAPEKKKETIESATWNTDLMYKSGRPKISKSIISQPAKKEEEAQKVEVKKEEIKEVEKEKKEEPKIEIKEVEKKIETKPPVNAVKQYSPILNWATTRPLEIAHDLDIRWELEGETLTPDKKIKDNDLLEILKNNPDVKYLDLSDCHFIENFTPLGKLEQLEELSLCNNPRLEDISFLKNLKNLKVLNLGSTGIEDISALSELKKLQVLNLKYNYIESLAPVNKLENLHDLVLWGCAGIDDLDSIANLTELRLVDVDSSTIKDINGVSNFKKINTLILDNCRIPDISPVRNLITLRCLTMEVKMMMPQKMFQNIENLTELRTLDLTKRGIRDVSLLKNMKKLLDLQLDSNCVVDITPLAGLTELRKLLLSGNKALRDLSPLSELTKMEVFYVQGDARPEAVAKMKIEDFSFMNKWTDMVEFGCGHNSLLKDIRPFANLEKLVILLMDGCTQVEDISPLRNLKNLQILHFLHCPRVSDVSCLKNLKAISSLYMDGTNVGAYSLSDFKNLKGTWDLSSNTASAASAYAKNSFARKRKVNNIRIKAEPKEEK